MPGSRTRPELIAYAWVPPRGVEPPRRHEVTGACVPGGGLEPPTHRFWAGGLYRWATRAWWTTSVSNRAGTALQGSAAHLCVAQTAGEGAPARTLGRMQTGTARPLRPPPLPLGFEGVSLGAEAWNLHRPAS